MDKSANRKLAYKWLGPYRVRKAIPEKGTYELEEFDRTLLAGTYSRNRLKKFIMRNSLYEPVQTPDDNDVDSVDSYSSDDNSDKNEDLPHAKDANGDIMILSEDEENESNDPNEDTPVTTRKPTQHFEIRPPTLTAEQRKEYVMYKEDNKGNLL